MNISLTIFLVIAVLLAMATAILAMAALEDGVVFPWQFLASYALGLCITHGQYFELVHRWMGARLVGDGLAGAVLSMLVGACAEGAMAALPMSAGLLLYVALDKADRRWPLNRDSEQTRCGKLVTFVRAFCIR